MAANIVSPFVADEIYSSSARAKCISIADAWLGSGSTAAVTTWGTYHTLVNAVLTAFSLTTISNGDTGAQWLAKMNVLNDAEQVLASVLSGWWNADRADLVTLSGSAVTSWKDSFHAYDTTQALGGSRPSYSATSFNGFPALTFDGTDDYLAMASQPFQTGATAGEIIANVEQNDVPGTTTTRRVVAFGGNTNNDVRHSARSVTGGVNKPGGLVGTGATSVSTNTIAGDYTGRHNSRIIFSGTAISAQMDGGTIGTPLAAVPATGTAGFVQIGRGTAGVGYWLGQIRDVMITSALLTTNQATYLQNYNTIRKAP